MFRFDKVFVTRALSALDKSLAVRYNRGASIPCGSSRRGAGIKSRLRESERKAMSTPTDDPRQEYASTYLVQDRSNQEEMTRLQIQDQMVTAGMGGVLPEQKETANF